MAKKRLTTVNRHEIVGTVFGSGGKIRTFENGLSIANFRVMTDSFRAAGDGTYERKAEYHNVQVWNNVYDDLYDLICEGNVVMVSGWHGHQNYTEQKTGLVKQFSYILARECSLLIHHTNPEHPQ
jgi:single-stranded DNA-binding protein